MISDASSYFWTNGDEWALECKQNPGGSCLAFSAASPLVVALFWAHSTQRSQEIHPLSNFVESLTDGA